MTEQNSGLPSELNFQPSIEAFEMPSGSELAAEAQRVIHDGELLYGKARVEGMPENLYAESMRVAWVRSRSLTSEMLLSGGDVNKTVILEELDSSDIFEDLPEPEVSEDPLFPVGYQVGYDISLEGKVESNVVQERSNLVKRFEEARRIAVEVGCSVEEVFLFEDSYQLLMQRTTSPQEVAAEVVDYVNRMNKTLEDIEGIETMEIDLDNLDWKNMDLSKPGTVIEDAEARLLELEIFTKRYIIGAIQRYWGNAEAMSFAYNSYQEQVSNTMSWAS